MVCARKSSGGVVGEDGVNADVGSCSKDGGSCSSPKCQGKNGQSASESKSTSGEPNPTKLTIGMATYDDAEGLWATIQALRLYHDLHDCEIVVVDNHPDSPHGIECKKYVESWASGWCRGARYIAMPENTGTTQPRNKIFEVARGENVLVMDSHVFIAPGAIRQLIDWYDSHPDSGDLLSGPMLYDDLRNYSTQFNNVWGEDAMWGKWGTDLRADSKDAVPWKPFPGGVNEFEIFSMGLGLFSCRRDKWLGFNPHFRGFGGEECYIHEKFRKAGRKCWCLPFLRWNHRFIRVGGAKYPAFMYWKARNYVLGKLELGEGLGEVHAAFVASGKLRTDEWERIVSDPIGNENPVGYVPEWKRKELDRVARGEGKSIVASAGMLVGQNPSFPAGQVVAANSSGGDNFPTKSRNGLPLPPPTLTLDGLFDWTKTVKRDWNEHLPKLRELASKCQHVTEFTKRRESTVALVAGCPRVVVSYQRENDELTQLLHHIVKRDKPTGLETFTSVESDALSADVIAETDMLVIDSIHSADRLYAELSKHASKVRKWLVIRGTEVFGEVAEGSSEPGLYHGLDRYFLEHPNEGWHKVYHAGNQYGVSVYSRDPAEPCIDRGPGTELTKMLRGLGVNPAAGCDCKAKARKMDEWGVKGCRDNQEMIVGWMREGVGRWGWSDRLKAAANAVASGLAFKLNPIDPFPGLVEEAISRAERREAEESAERKRLKEIDELAKRIGEAEAEVATAEAAEESRKAADTSLPAGSGEAANQDKGPVKSVERLSGFLSRAAEVE